MSTVNITGFLRDTEGSYILKDPEAQLVYTLDWSQWLPTADTVTAVDHSLQVRANDPAPLVEVSEGIVSGNKTYIELSGGQVGKTYRVTAEITTNDGNTDRRYFRIKVENRSA